MSAGFQAILWNKQKKCYDIIFVSAILLYLTVYFTINTLLYPTITFETMLIRSFGTLALVMLHIILSIGPLARLNNKFLVLLYNRRHLGVTMFLMASVHALFSIFQFHANGNISPILSVFVSNTHYNSFIYFPFQTLGFAAYIILMLMAFTSHDFWLSVLSPKVWKTLHILVYLAYLLLILHVLLGVIQLENSPIYFVMLLLGVLWLACLHVYAAYKENKFDNRKLIEKEGWVKVCSIDEIEDSKAKMIFANGERIAVFKYGNKLSAVHNVCKHQNGPLGEGKIVDGCITCPWHGYQYEPANGCAPDPFTEKVATYYTRVIGNDVWLHPSPLPEGTFVEPTIILDGIFQNKSAAKKDTVFYIGWQPTANKVFSLFAKKVSLVIVCFALLSAVFISFNQQHIATSYFKDLPPQYQGQLIAEPFPALRTIAGKDIYGNPIIKTYPLVNAWKFGASNVVKDFIRMHGNNPYVKIEGATMESDGVQLIQLNNGELSISCGIKHSENCNDSACCQPKYASAKDSIILNNRQTPITAINNLIFITPVSTNFVGEVTIAGEIIDPKCYFGAMNPGLGKPHRSCAIRCIEGGIMPMVAYKENGKMNYAVLVGENGQPLNKVIGYAVAEPVQLKGKLFTIDNWKVLQVKIPDGLLRTTVKNK
jgi:nitrite reductase/ring-hydroxylating ferredoxin subunit/DMSO/TMAO reductase YedYZ heme-binding membrane subunit